MPGLTLHTTLMWYQLGDMIYNIALVLSSECPALTHWNGRCWKAVAIKCQCFSRLVVIYEGEAGKLLYDSSGYSAATKYCFQFWEEDWRAMHLNEKMIYQHVVVVTPLPDPVASWYSLMVKQQEEGWCDLELHPIQSRHHHLCTTKNNMKPFLCSFQAVVKSRCVELLVSFTEQTVMLSL